MHQMVAYERRFSGFLVPHGVRFLVATPLQKSSDIGSESDDNGGSCGFWMCPSHPACARSSVLFFVRLFVPSAVCSFVRVRVRSFDASCERSGVRSFLRFFLRSSAHSLACSFLLFPLLLPLPLFLTGNSLEHNLTESKGVRHGC